MNTQNLNQQDYYLTGAVKSAVLYFGRAMVGGARAVKAPAIGCFDGQMFRCYIDKKGSAWGMNWLRTTPLSELEEQYEDFKVKWSNFDTEFYTLATNTNDWRKAWRRVDELNEAVLYEGYGVETIDPFADEIETEIKAGLMKSGIDTHLFHDLITPSQPTDTQKQRLALHEVQNGTLSMSEYCRTYWYALGSWAGGKLLTPNDVEIMLIETLPNLREFEVRAKIHEMADLALDGETRHLVQLLRLLTLWRETRKTSIQRFCLSYKHILAIASNDLGLPSNLVQWLVSTELDAVNEEELKERAKANVIIADGQSSDLAIIVGEEAKQIIKAFRPPSDSVEVKGTVASKGVAQGEANIVLSEDDFHTFQQGQILITTMTRPEFVPLMRLAKAVVTDEGGLTSHAAIVSREFGIPCIVGTKHATHTFRSGDQIDVDAVSGTVVKII